MAGKVREVTLESGIPVKPVYGPEDMDGAMGITGQETEGWTKAEAEARVAETIQRSLRQIFAMAAKEDLTTEAAARRIAEKRLWGVPA